MELYLYHMFQVIGTNSIRKKKKKKKLGLFILSLLVLYNVCCLKKQTTKTTTTKLSLRISILSCIARLKAFSLTHRVFWSSFRTLVVSSVSGCFHPTPHPLRRSKGKPFHLAFQVARVLRMSVPVPSTLGLPQP